MSNTTKVSLGFLASSVFALLISLGIRTENVVSGAGSPPADSIAAGQTTTSGIDSAPSGYQSIYSGPPD